MNLGILHRDISDGNVMLLREPQGYRRREWLEERSEDVEALRGQFGDMAESESKLRKVLNSLNRDPTGMVSDFDLHTKHRSAPPIPGGADDVLPPTCEPGITSLLRSSVSPTSQTLREQHSDLPSKRLKTNSSTPVPTLASTFKNDKNGHLAWVSARLKRRRSRGTPADDQNRPVSIRI